MKTSRKPYYKRYYSNPINRKALYLHQTKTKSGKAIVKFQARLEKAKADLEQLRKVSKSQWEINRLLTRIDYCNQKIGYHESNVKQLAKRIYELRHRDFKFGGKDE